MRILALGDIHGSASRVQKIVELIHNKGVDLVLVTGDLTGFGNAKEAEKVLKPLEGFKVLAIPGNMDSQAVLEILEEKGISLHGKKEKIGKFAFVGFGGGLIGDPGEFLSSESRIGKRLSSLLDREKNAILLTHLPPFGTSLDSSHSGTNIGSKAVKEVIEKKQPLLHLCGHCHEAVGEEKIGKTTSINIGAVKDDRALMLELGEELKWEEILI